MPASAASRAFSAVRVASSTVTKVPASFLRLKLSPMTSEAWPPQLATAPRVSNRTFIRPKALLYSQAWPMQTVSPLRFFSTVG